MGIPKTSQKITSCHNIEITTVSCFSNIAFMCIVSTVFRENIGDLESFLQNS